MKTWMEFVKQPNARPVYDGRVLISKEDYDRIQQDAIGNSLGVQRIAAERARQVEKEGWTPEHDAQHKGGELSLAASCYAERANLQIRGIEQPEKLPFIWPWAREWWKPGDAIRNLEKAGALIAAELDRLLKPL